MKPIYQENKLPLLMTASVNTRGMKNACFTDEEREDMYAKTLQIYINKLLTNVSGSGYKLVFVENSGWDLIRIQNKIQIDDRSQIEFISLDPTVFDISKGKGYNELLLIKLAINQSRFISESKAFLKVTGRYPIYNIQYFLDEASRLFFSKGIDLYIDIKDHKIYDWLHLGWNGHSADVRLFAVSVDFFLNQIAYRYVELNDYNGFLFEGLMYDIVKSNMKNKNIVCRFKKEMHLGGFEGSNVNAVSFSKDQNSFKGKIKRIMGNFIRRFLPFFWF